MRRKALLAGVALSLVAGIAAIVMLLPYLQPSVIKFLDLFPASGGAPAHVATADLTDAGPGSLVSATTMPGVTRTFAGRDIQAARVLYLSLIHI